jgi:type IV pilus assembly protein PilA
MGNDRGFTLIEVLIVVAIIGIIAALSIAGLLRARIAGNEASAIGTMRAIVSAQADYMNANNGYATDLSALATPCPGSSVAWLGGDIDANGVTKSGYAFTIAVGAGGVPGSRTDCNGTATTSTYFGTAIPESLGSTGNRAFSINQHAAIWQNTAGTPPPEPLVLAGTITPLGR